MQHLAESLWNPGMPRFLRSATTSEAMAETGQNEPETGQPGYLVAPEQITATYYELESLSTGIIAKMHHAAMIRLGKTEGPVEAHLAWPLHDPARLLRE